MATHQELIKAGSFDDKFKNALRDYYVYGFKSLAELQSTNEKGKLEPSKPTINADWVRLTNILQNYFEWSTENNIVYFMSADSQSMNGNPFHRVYRFCRYNERDPKSFFSTVFALSPHISLRDGVESLEIDDLIDFDAEIYKRFVKNLENGAPLSSAELLCFFPDDVETLFIGENNTINNKLKELNRLGLICDVAANKGQTKKITHRWALTNSFLVGLLANQGDESFIHRFENAVDFFSQYSLMGEVGGILLARSGHSGESAFRFKHEYFMQCLNDYNLIDLLYAIENGLWCEINYRKGINGRQSIMVCYPLEIRTSSTSGRQYVACYDPFSRTFSNLRIEFIDAIAYICDGDIKTPNGGNISCQQAHIRSDIENAKRALHHSWGASTSKRKRSDARRQAQLERVRIRVAYDPATEGHIFDRLNREQRIGDPKPNAEKGYIDFSVMVTDPRELRPWIRSFYTRLLAFDGIEDENFKVFDDLMAIKKVCDEGALPNDHTSNKSETITTGFRNTPNGTDYKTIPCSTHQSLFNEFFSIYYFAIAETLMAISHSSGDEAFTKDELGDLINRCLNIFGASFGNQTKRLLSAELKDYLTSEVFLRTGYRVEHTTRVDWQEDKTDYFWSKEYVTQDRCKTVRAFQPKYCAAAGDFYRDFLPLTLLECRWLLTIMDNPKMHLFLSQNEIDSVKMYLSERNPSLVPFPEDKIIYTDRFVQKERVHQQEQAVMNRLLTAIEGCKLVFVDYISRKGKRETGVFAPAVIEYSKRDNMFRGYFYSKRENSFSIKNIAQIQQFRVLDKTFNYADVMKRLGKYRKRNSRQITLEFYDTKNTADRILSEFSPWKKRCEYDRESGRYTLTIYYQKQDSAELVVRLLGYGANIRILDKESLIYAEYSKRINKQIAFEQARAANAQKAKGAHDEPARV